MPLSMAERFVKHEEDFKKGKPVIVGADINFFAQLAGGYEEQMSCVVKNCVRSWGMKIMQLRC